MAVQIRELGVGGMGLIAVVLGVATLIIHILFAVGVYHAADHRASRGGVHFVPPWVWCCATLLGGVFVAVAFWLMHLSTLALTPPRGDDVQVSAQGLDDVIQEYREEASEDVSLDS